MKVLLLELIVQVFFENSHSGADFELGRKKIEYKFENCGCSGIRRKQTSAHFFSESAKMTNN
ncbi:MAG: hypothetical protein A2020_00710 [Lentisphaerae bacterium GWF2_45_14]|nr:MAG: hypothetical protein A2020_00710 [Lentisphaerae bacterium GWF2_45_14]